MTAMIKSETYTVITDKHCELPKGSKLTVTRRPVQTCELCVFKLNGSRLTLGRWLPDILGSDWIIQPGRWIEVGNAKIQILGAVKE